MYNFDRPRDLPTGKEGTSGDEEELTLDKAKEKFEGQLVSHNKSGAVAEAKNVNERNKVGGKNGDKELVVNLGKATWLVSDIRLATDEEIEAWNNR